MEFDKIQQLSSTAKVMRANSEQQRRRREQNAREFSELLEENLDEEDGATQEPAEPVEPAATQDTVSISSTGKVSAETMQAAGNLARISLAQRQMLDLFNPSFNTIADAAEPGEPESEHSQIDEVV